MKRSRTICLILESVSAIALFLPWCYLEKYYSHGTNTHTYNQNFFGGLSAGGGVISYIVLLLMLVSIAWLVKGIISGKKISLLEFLLPIFSLVFLAISVFSITATNPIYWLGVITGIIGLVGWCFSYPVYKKVKLKQEEINTPLIEEQYNTIYDSCEQAQKLLN